MGGRQLVAIPIGALSAGSDPSARVVFAIAVILLIAKIGGDLAVRARQPAVLGELVLGVFLGNLGLAGIHGLDWIGDDPFVEMFARVGVLILLFEVGLESTVAQMFRVGGSALLVALLGVAAPFALGWGVGAWLLPTHSVYVHAFLGATLSATSVGITARVLKDLGRSSSPEARIILGAAVLDDVLGLIILAAVTGIIAAADRGERFGAAPLAWIVARAIAFLGASLGLGVAVAPRAFRFASRLKSPGMLLATGLILCFALSWLADRIGLAPIVGAFAAGLLLEPSHYQRFVERGERSLEDLIHPVAAFLVPIFFVRMGMRVDLASMADPGVLGLAGALVAAAIVGKQACAFGVISRGADRIAVGMGMIPRGEVGLIFASIGLSLTVHGERVVDAGTFSAVVVMVIVTTLVTPPMLAWRMRGRSGS